MALLADGAAAPVIGTLSEHAQLAIVDGDIVGGPDGVVGVSLGGPFAADAWVSQGCVPFGPTMVVTRAQGDTILELGGMPAIQIIQREVAALPEERRKLLAAGLFLGCVVSEYREYFGRDDFVVTPIRRVIRDDEAVTVAEPIRVGQTVRLHLKDTVAATQDLTMVLDMQRLRGQASAALMFAPQRVDEAVPGPGLDASIVSRMLSGPEAGEQLAKSGRRLDPGARPSLPLAGTIAPRQIGPLGQLGHRQTFCHAQCTVLTVFRPRQAGE
jgi:small ligand-binding sensory domain FIST